MSNYKHHVLFNAENYKLVLVGLGLIVAGFIAMVGGGSAPDLTTTYPEDTLYGFRTTVLAPMLVLAGFAMQAVAIFKKPSNDEVQELQQMAAFQTVEESKVKTVKSASVKRKSIAKNKK